MRVRVRRLDPDEEIRRPPTPTLDNPTQLKRGKGEHTKIHRERSSGSLVDSDHGGRKVSVGMHSTAGSQLGFSVPKELSISQRRAKMSRQLAETVEHIPKKGLPNNT